MADTNENKGLNDEIKTAPIAAALTGIGGNGAPLKTDASPVPVTADSVKEKNATQDKAAQIAQAEEKLQKEKEASLKSLDSKADGFAKKNPAPKKKDAPAQAKTAENPKAEKSPKTLKEKKTASVRGSSIGGTGGKSVQTTGKDDPSAPVKTAISEPPKDATRPGKKETIIYIDHSELHPFKNHPFQVRDDDAMKSLVDSIKEAKITKSILT